MSSPRPPLIDDERKAVIFAFGLLLLSAALWIVAYYVFKALGFGSGEGGV